MDQVSNLRLNNRTNLTLKVLSWYTTFRQNFLKFSLNKENNTILTRHEIWNRPPQMKNS